jgi:uncharacterized protein (TIGR02444 family)
VTSQGRLWTYAVTLYAAPGVEPLLIKLQDDHGQCPPFLLWALWLAAERRPADAKRLAEAAAWARPWWEEVVTPLRRLRRELKRPLVRLPDADREGLRQKTADLELEAERIMLGMLETASLTEGADRLDALGLLDDAVAAWGISGAGRSCYLPMLEKLAAESVSMDEKALDPEEQARIRAQIAELRQEHQDLDDAVRALETLPTTDQLQVARLKKKKLTLRDQIAKLEDQLTPDIIA